MSWRALVIAMSVFGCARTTARLSPRPTRTAPISPVLTVPSAIVAETSGVVAQITQPIAGLSYDWQLLGGTLTSPSRGASVTFTASAAGAVLYAVKVSNEVGDTAPPATASSAIVPGLPANYQPQLLAAPRVLAGRAGNRAELTNPIAGASYAWQVSGNGTLDASTATSAAFTGTVPGSLTLTLAASVPGATGGTRASAQLAIAVVTPPQSGLTLVAGQLGGPGYLDGPIAAALFPAPGSEDVSLLATPDGALWEADANQCTIRVIKDGVVSSVGSPHDCRMVDGDSLGARLRYPQQMAAADNGEIWFIDNPYPYGGVNSFGSVLRRANRNGSVTSYGAAFSKLTPDYSSSNCASIDAASAPLPLATSVFCAGPKNVVTTTNGDVYVASAGSGPRFAKSLRSTTRQSSRLWSAVRLKKEAPTAWLERQASTTRARWLSLSTAPFMSLIAAMAACGASTTLAP